MSTRKTVCDYAGTELYRGDLVTYAARVGNRVRMTDAEILHIEARKVDGRLRPMILVKPTGDESGFVQRRSMAAQWISNEHVRLIR